MKTRYIRENIKIKHPGIYKIESLNNGKIYIGSSVNINSRIFQGHVNKLKKGTHYNNHLQNHANKHRIDDLSFEILKLCLKSRLIKWEQYYIDALKPEFNICQIAYSPLGIKRSEECKEKHRIHFKEMWTNPEYRKSKTGTGNSFYGKHHSEETKRKLSKLAQNRKCPEEAKQKISKSSKKRWKNSEYSEQQKIAYKNFWESEKGKEAKQKISVRMKMFTHSEKSKIKMSDVMKVFYQTNEGIKNRQNRKKRIQGKKILCLV